jgi:hypothetical protein
MNNRLKIDVSILFNLHKKAGRVAAITEDLMDSEALTPVNVQSHGNMIYNLESEIEEMLRLVKAFKLEVQGR